jgi:enterochelin esterase-like enzyme
MLSRRALLLGVGGVAALAAVGAAAEMPAVRGRVLDVFDPEPSAPTPVSASGPRASGVLVSQARGRTVSWRVAYPPGHQDGDGLPVALVLHGRGGDADSAFDEIWLDRYLADTVRTGAAPFALASVDGGGHTYWHRRTDGDDPQAMLTEEFLPMLGRRGLITSRFGVLGWSMGSYGALLLAETVGAQRVAAVAVDSPAVWQRAEDAAQGAFDDAQDFHAHDVLARTDRLSNIPVRVACGNRDPFYAAARELVRRIPDLAAADFSTGGHTDTFWRRTATDQLRFLSRALSGTG